ncbi:hypothetical protein QEG98_04710 [Myxococcus sp. MxC21-1]|uniref:hypothetical protein n=1 Tax=Myxococcus sp. MxC21-1 TaxID=3041439 RepID=UPI00292E7D96|nr:hypothetical protein [Myxococcus sp. MxC21-1]WNZ63093.1 hypothetical protein QEG98_04710 [Myxococcus sp. MxC21-1]
MTLPKQSNALAASALPCIQERFARVRPPKPEYPQNALGVAYLTARPSAEKGRRAVSQATTFLGYELKVSGTQGERPWAKRSWCCVQRRCHPRACAPRPCWRAAARRFASS